MKFFNTKRNLILLVVLMIFCVGVFSQSITQPEKKLRFPLWAMLDEMPSAEYKAQNPNNLLEFSVGRMKEISPFVLEGMIYGWNFSYTPYDKKRGVQEYFEFEPIVKIDGNNADIKYTDVRIFEEKLECFVEYERTDAMMHRLLAWQGIKNPKISGKGRGKVADGVEGIQKAFSDSLKNAVREYARGMVKNKPKEISGQVLLVDYPRLYIDAGSYVANLDFLLKLENVIPYTHY